MSNFFIKRPIVAMVIAIITVIVGAVSVARLPVSQFPNIVPPEIQLLATYVGADAQTLEQSVATRHFFPSPHGPQADPPQSTSVSVPSFVASAQPAVWQSPTEQTPAMQSVPSKQVFPFAHRSQ